MISPLIWCQIEASSPDFSKKQQIQWHINIKLDCPSSQVQNEPVSVRADMWGRAPDVGTQS